MVPATEKSNDCGESCRDVHHTVPHEFPSLMPNERSFLRRKNFFRSLRRPLLFGS